MTKQDFASLKEGTHLIISTDVFIPGKGSIFAGQSARISIGGGYPGAESKRRQCTVKGDNGEIGGRYWISYWAVELDPEFLPVEEASK